MNCLRCGQHIQGLQGVSCSHCGYAVKEGDVVLSLFALNIDAMNTGLKERWKEAAVAEKCRQEAKQKTTPPAGTAATTPQATTSPAPALAKMLTKRNVLIAAGVALVVIGAIVLGQNSLEKRVEEVKDHSAVARIDNDAKRDMNGYWNDIDIRIVCDALIEECLDSPQVKQAIDQKENLPAIIVGEFRNDSSEFIDTRVISSFLETAILNSGLADFATVGGNKVPDYTFDETRAYFLLTGTVKTIIDRQNDTLTRTYFVSIKLTNLKTSAVVLTSLNDSIKKTIVNNRINP